MFNQSQVDRQRVRPISRFTLSLTIVVLLLTVFTASAETYHVDAARGDDARTSDEATEPRTPWKSIQKAAAVAEAGDTVIVSSGVYRETVRPARSGTADSPITFRAADAEQRPVISGADLIDADRWEAVSLTNFRGEQVNALVTSIEGDPSMVFDDGARMVLAQEPNQPNADDPFDISRYRTVPDQRESNTLRDAEFFADHAAGTDWTGATLLLWNSHNRAVQDFEISESNIEEGQVTVWNKAKPIIGYAEGKPADRYAIRNHLAVLDQPGEYFVDRSVKPHRLYIVIEKHAEPAAISIASRAQGFLLEQGRSHIVIDGFAVREHQEDGIRANSADHRNVAIRNCELTRNMGSGIKARYLEGLTIENCFIARNDWNGLHLANVRDVKVIGCEITANGDNGIWIGSGQPTPWNSEGILIRDCYLHHASGQRRHPDNFQMHQVRDVTIERTVMVQENNHQNMWCQYTDDFTMRNNVFVGGKLGINSSINSKLYHNVFWNAGIRYDRHLTNHRELTDHFLIKSAKIQNNVFVNSGISWPDEELVDRFAVFTVDHNAYSLANDHDRQSWDFQGYKLALQSETLLVAEPSITSSDGLLEVSLGNHWSNASRLLMLYQDPQNYYWIGLGDNRGVYRRINGEDTLVLADPDGALALPHASGAEASFRIQFVSEAGAVRFKIQRTMPGQKPGEEVEVRDEDQSAIESFANGRVGVLSPEGQDGWVWLNELKITRGDEHFNDRFADRSTNFEGDHNQKLAIVRGEVEFKTKGGFGIGFGEGSLVIDDPARLETIFVKTPDHDGATFDFRLSPKSKLIDAGLDVGVRLTLDGQRRDTGRSPAIGPFEPVDVAAGEGVN